MQRKDDLTPHLMPFYEESRRDIQPSTVDVIVASPPCFSLFGELVFYFSFCVTQVGSKIRTFSRTSSIACFYYLTSHNENEDILHRNIVAQFKTYSRFIN